MFFTITLYLSLTICLVGIAYRMWQWFNVRVGPESLDISRKQRIAATTKAIAVAAFGRSAYRLMRALIFDCVIQRRLFREDVFSWAAPSQQASPFDPVHVLFRKSEACRPLAVERQRVAQHNKRSSGRPLWLPWSAAERCRAAGQCRRTRKICRLSCIRNCSAGVWVWIGGF